MNSSVNFLPTEVLLTTFQNLPRTELYKCLYVCRSWNRVATPEYLKEIILTDEKIDKWRQNSALNRDVFEEEGTPGRNIFPNSNHVLSLKVDGNSGFYRTDSEELFMVLYNMPNVREIDLYQASGYLYSLLSILKETISIGKEYNFNPLKSLQRFILPANCHNFYARGAPYMLEDYYFICSQNTRSITHFRLVLNSQHIITNNMLPIEYKSFRDLFENLSNLTNLEIFCVEAFKKS